MTTNDYRPNIIKVIIRHCLPWGNFSTQAIDLDLDSDVKQLNYIIEQKFRIPSNKQIIKFNRDGFTLRVIPGWPIRYYDIKDKAILYVEKLENHGQKDGVNMLIDGYKMQGRYYARLGILSVINDEDEGDQEERLTKKIRSRRNSEVYDGNGMIELNFESRLKEEADKLIKDIKEGNLKKIKDILTSLTPNTQISDNNDNSKIKKLIDELGSSGWNSLHFTIFLGYPMLVKEFIDYNADINLETSDGWTPLQLAIYKNQPEIVKMLLKCAKINLNVITKKGSALHVAAQSGKIDFVQQLLTASADFYVEDSNGDTPSQVASTEEIRKLIEKQGFIRHNNDAFKPPKPPIVKGWIYKKSGPFQLYSARRYLILNPDEGTLIRYKSLEDYPNKPVEVIPLKDIINVQRIGQDWFSNKDYHYFELTHNSRYIFAAKTKEAIKKWVKLIYQGIVYALYVEDQIRDDEMDPSPMNRTSSIQELKSSKTQEIVEILDIPNTESENNNNKQERHPKSPSPNSNWDKDTIDKSIKSENVHLSEDQNKNQLEALEKLIDKKVNFKSFEVLKLLGTGAFGKVYKVRKKDTGKIYALKALKKRQLATKNQLQYAITECNVLKNANHPFILTLHYAFQTPAHLYLVLDYCPKGDLSLHLAQKVTFTEDQARFYIAELVLAIEHLHSIDVIYRDLKPENILIAEDDHIKLADFSLAKEDIKDNGTATSFCGSPAYLSPEMLKYKSVGKAADIYGIGAVLYEMLQGQSPFYNDDIPKMYASIKRGQLTFPKPINETTKSFILKLMARDPKERLGSKDKNDIKNDPYFNGLDWNKILNKEYLPPILDALGDSDDDDDGVGFTSGMILKDVDYEEKSKKPNKIDNYTFVRSQGINKRQKVELGIYDFVLMTKCF